MTFEDLNILALKKGLQLSKTVSGQIILHRPTFFNHFKSSLCIGSISQCKAVLDRL